MLLIEPPFDDHGFLLSGDSLKPQYLSAPNFVMLNSA
jgi:hypothetical protein